MHFSIRRSAPLLLLTFAMVWSACSGSKTNLRGDDGMMSDYEDFNSAAYPVDEPTQDIEHDVPTDLMNPTPAGGNTGGTAGGNTGGNTGNTGNTGNAGNTGGNTGNPPATGQTREGYRVQIMASDQQGSATRVENEARSWWQNNRNAAPAVLANDFPVFVIFQSPYYKVRVGNFINRSEADQAVTFLRQMYPDAWVVRDQIIY